VLGAYPNRGSFHQEPCLQCPTAECLYVCPVNALRVEPTTGARFIREDVCVACNRCAEACIFPTSPEENATNQLKFNQESASIRYDPVQGQLHQVRPVLLARRRPSLRRALPVNIRIRQGILKVDAVACAWTYPR